MFHNALTGASFLTCFTRNMQGVFEEYTSKVADIRIAIVANFRL
jgi:hypothetical protein